jgi:peptide/nickel transport system permease protein
MLKLRQKLFVLAITWIATILIVAVFRQWLPLSDPLNVDLGAMLTPPGTRHWLGTDELGRDLLARLFAAARATFIITAGATALNLVLGALLGGISGFLGGWWDVLLSFLIDLFWSVPFLIFVVLIVSVTGVSVPTLILTIGLINWVTPARIVRAETLRLREMEFVRTARAFGYTQSSVFLREILPNLRTTLVALLAFSAIEVLTLETGLAFLGLSLPEPTPTWGGLLASGLSYLASAWWITVFTAVLIILTLASLQMLSRGLDTARLLESK